MDDSCGEYDDSVNNKKGEELHTVTPRGITEIA